MTETTFVKSMATLQYLWLHLLILFLCSHKPLFSTNASKLHPRETASIQFNYDRFPEVVEKCGPLLSSRSKLAPDDTRGWRLRDFYFANGDWSQDSGSTPLMPFQDIQNDYTGKENAVNLASFQVVDVDHVQRMRDTVSVSGVLDLAISRGIVHISWRYRRLSPEFDMHPGQSRLAILFEGIYAESEGEQLMCLLGTAKMPTHEQSFLDRPMQPMEAFGQRHDDQARGRYPYLVKDDQIMLVLKYPKALTLTGRGIWGEMTSSNERSEARYFDRVSLSSQLMGDGLKYQFGAEELLKRACDPYPCRDESLDKEEELVLFRGDSFCDDLQQFVFNAVFNFVPSKEYNQRANKDQNWDPFGFGMDIEHLRLLIQDPRCQSRLDRREMTVNVSAVIRLIPPWENQEMSKDRTGLNGTVVLSAEGTWRSSLGQLCMIACSIEPILSTPHQCNYRICLYMPRTFSLTRRSIVFGTISMIHHHHHSSLRFEMPDSRVTAEKYYCNAPNRSYEYTGILEASSFQKQRSPSVLEMLLRRPILQYPTIYGSERTSLSSLSKELHLNALVIPQGPFSMENRALLDLHILSLGSFFSWYQENELNPEESSGKNYLEEAIPVAGHLSISGGSYVENMSFSLAFEGVYDQNRGKMTLLACRDMHAFRWGLTADVNLSLREGKDCLVEAEIEYPPQNFMWLMNPTVKISITSKRATQDPHQFPPVDLTLPWIRFRNQFNDILYREKFEAALRIFLLSLSVFCIFSQLKAGPRYISFLSLSMLGLQATGYCIPFISGNEVLFKRLALRPHSYRLQDTAGFKFFDLLALLDSSIRVLMLVAFLLTLRLFQKVRNSRRSYQNAKAFEFQPCNSIQRIRIPDEKRVLRSTSAFHLLGFFIFNLVAEKLTPQVMFIQEEQNWDYSRNKHIQKPVPWLMRVDDYTSVVQDLFLLPQVLSNIRLKIGGKPLRKSFYMGLTIVRVMVRIYDSVRDPVPDDQPGLTVHYTTGFKVYTRFWNIGVAVAAATLAVILNLQQQCKSSDDSEIDSDNLNDKLL